jgi:hypothetical protein
MKESTLRHFRDLADAVSTREKIEIGIVTDRGTLTGAYDPMFKTVSVSGITVPEKELGYWLRVIHDAEIVSIRKGEAQ